MKGVAASRATTNKDVVNRFLSKEVAVYKLNTDGTTLYSYGQAIAKWHNGRVVILNECNRAGSVVDRQRHIRLVCNLAGINNIPIVVT